MPTDCRRIQGGTRLGDFVIEFFIGSKTTFRLDPSTKDAAIAKGKVSSQAALLCGPRLPRFPQPTAIGRSGTTRCVHGDARNNLSTTRHTPDVTANCATSLRGKGCSSRFGSGIRRPGAIATSSTRSRGLSQSGACMRQLSLTWNSKCGWELLSQLRFTNCMSIHCQFQLDPIDRCWWRFDPTFESHELDRVLCSETRLAVTNKVLARPRN